MITILVLPVIVGLIFWSLDKREDSKRGCQPKKKGGCLQGLIIAILIIGIFIFFIAPYFNSSGYSKSSFFSSVMLAISCCSVVAIVPNLFSSYQWRKKTALGCLLPFAIMMLICGLVLRSSSSEPSYGFSSNHQSNSTDYPFRPIRNQ